MNRVPRPTPSRQTDSRAPGKDRTAPRHLRVVEHVPYRGGLAELPSREEADRLAEIAEQLVAASKRLVAAAEQIHCATFNRTGANKQAARVAFAEVWCDLARATQALSITPSEAARSKQDRRPSLPDRYPAPDSSVEDRYIVGPSWLRGGAL